MATATSFYLQPPTTDDMDVSNSPTHANDDIEIDIDDSATNNDEHMGDDEERLTLADDEMHDDEHETTNSAVTAAPTSYLHDDDLIDYSDDDEPVLQTSVESTTQPGENPQEDAPILVFEERATVAEDEGHGSADNTIETTDLAEDTTAHATFDGEEQKQQEQDDYIEYRELEDYAEDEPGADAQDAVQVDAYGQDDLIDYKEVEDHADEEPNAAVQSATQDQAAVDDDLIEYKDLDEETVAHEQATLDTADTSAYPVDGPPTPTDTGLHPVVFYYEDRVFPLFKSKSAPDGLLKDDNIVSLSLADLIKHCRQRLCIKLDRELADDYEALFTFNNLHLTIVEDSPACFQTSLKEVLDTYIQLKLNDGFQDYDIPALDVTCTLQLKFNNSITILQKAAANGDGFSTVITESYDEYDDIQHDDQIEEEGVNGEDTAEQAGDAEYDAEADADEQAKFAAEHYGDDDEEYHDDETHDHIANGTNENNGETGQENDDSQDWVLATESGDETYDGGIEQQGEQSLNKTPIPDSATGAVDITSTTHEPMKATGGKNNKTAIDSVHESSSSIADKPANGEIAAKISSTSYTAPVYDDELIDYSDDDDEITTNGLKSIEPAVTTAASTKVTPTKRGRDTSEDNESLANKKPRPS